MLGKIFPAKIDHPMADAKEARKILAQLPAMEASLALDSATAWLESLIMTPEFKPEHRLDLIFRLDDSVLPQARKITREYLTSIRQTRSQEFRTWQIGHSYWSVLASAYRQTLTLMQSNVKVIEVALKPHLPLLFVRLFHASGNELKWTHFRYGPIDGGFWLSAGFGLQEAIRGKVANTSIRMYSFNGDSTPTAEYQKILLMEASSLDKLQPVEMEIAERLIAHLLPSFFLRDEARPDNVYWVDLAKPLPPTRLLVVPEITPTLRFFPTASAITALEGLRTSIETKEALPNEVNFGGQYSTKVVLPVIHHLSRCWAPHPPTRNHQRRSVKSRMSIVHGLDAVTKKLQQIPGAEITHDSWEVENVSQGGIGAQATTLVGRGTLKVGSLLAMCPEGGDNWLVGMVRRFSQVTESKGSVGIETLSKSPVALMADSKGLATEAIALDPITTGSSIRLVLAASAWEEQSPLSVGWNDRRLRLMPVELIDAGVGHVVSRYHVSAADE